MKNNHTYDAIVVGSGMTGERVVKEPTEKGLRAYCTRAVERCKTYRSTHTTTLANILLQSLYNNQ